MKYLSIAAYSLFLFCGACAATSRADIKNEADKINYSVGYQVGGDLKSQGIDLNSEVFVQGIRDVLSNTPPRLSKSEMDTTLIALKRKIVADERAKVKQAGVTFLAENAKKNDFTVLPSGVQYKVLHPGSGKKPTLNDQVKVHYRITRADGTEIGSTYGSKPRTLLLSKTIPGLREVLLLMEEGAKWQVVIPTGTAAGGKEPMDDMGVLIYDLELLSVLPEPQSAGTPPVKTP
jgi:FKBP-type peptidyl-prolyl cis-trans isomerase FklB